MHVTFALHYKVIVFHGCILIIIIIRENRMNSNVFHVVAIKKKLE